MATAIAISPPRMALRAVRMHGVQSRKPTDGELIGRIAEGDRRAFEELYGRYARAVLGLALRRLRDRERAEDATQDAFVAIWRSARTYDPLRGGGAPWLYTIARNAITDRFRRSPEQTAELQEGPGSAPDPAEEAEREWSAWCVHRALETLPAHERPVIELAYWRGLSQTEIAESLQLPLGTVKTRTRSALRRLAEALEEEGLT